MFLKKQNGFTLLELLIVIVIIAILLLIAIPQFKNYVIRSQITEAFSLIQPVKLAVGEYVQETGKWPEKLDDLKMENEGGKGKYVSEITVEKGTIHAKYSSTGDQKASSEIDGKHLSFVVAFSEGKAKGSLLYYCNGKDSPAGENKKDANDQESGARKTDSVDKKYLPANCRV